MSYYHHSSSERCMKANSQFYASIASECTIVFLYNYKHIIFILNFSLDSLDKNKKTTMNACGEYVH